MRTRSRKTGACTGELAACGRYYSGGQLEDGSPRSCLVGGRGCCTPNDGGTSGAHGGSQNSEKTTERDSTTQALSPAFRAGGTAPDQEKVPDPDRSAAPARKGSDACGIERCPGTHVGANGGKQRSRSKRL